MVIELLMSRTNITFIKKKQKLIKKSILAAYIYGNEFEF